MSSTSCLLVLTACFATAATGMPNSPNGISLLFDQLKGLQVVIRLPEEYYSSSVATENLLQLTLVHLEETSETPFQLFFQRKRMPTFQPARHTPNTVAWLILSNNFSATKQIKLATIIDSCFSWPDQYFAFSLLRDLMHLVLIDNGNALQRPTFFAYVRRCYTPFFLLTLTWSLPNNLRTDAEWAFDTCFMKPNCRAVDLPNYLEVARRDTQVLIQHVIRARVDYVGVRLQVYPFLKLYAN